MPHTRQPLYRYAAPRHWPVWTGLGLLRLVCLLPHRLAYGVARLEPYGFLILILLLFTGLLGHVLWPIIGMMMALVGGAFGVPLGILVRLTNLVS